jgi:hypothetical protein
MNMGGMSVRSAAEPLLIQKVLRADMVHFRFISFLIALGIYAAFGSPTPDHPGLIEVLIGGFLMGAILPSIKSVIGFSQKQPIWFRAGQVLLFIVFSAHY